MKIQSARQRTRPHADGTGQNWLLLRGGAGNDGLPEGVGREAAHQDHLLTGACERMRHIIIGALRGAQGLFHLRCTRQRPQKTGRQHRVMRSHAQRDITRATCEMPGTPPLRHGVQSAEQPLTQRRCGAMTSAREGSVECGSWSRHTLQCPPPRVPCQALCSGLKLEALACRSGRTRQMCAGTTHRRLTASCCSTNALSGVASDPLTARPMHNARACGNAERQSQLMFRLQRPLAI